MNLLPLDDPRWATYRGGYNRAPCDVVSLIRKLLTHGATEDFWQAVWNDLHHQGDVGEASYAIIPYLVEYQSHQLELDEQLYGYCVVVDLARPENGNPTIPHEIELAYTSALRRLPVIGAELMRRGCSEATVMGVAATTALAAGHRTLARAYIELNREDALEYLRNLNGFEPGPHD
jgi:hypothetical protein